MDIDPSVWLLILGIVIGWAARYLVARGYTINPDTPTAARETLKTIADAAADGKITAGELASIAGCILKTAATLAPKKEP